MSIRHVQNTIYQTLALGYITSGICVTGVLSYLDYNRNIVNKNNVITRVLTNVSAGLMWPVTLYLAQSTKSGGSDKLRLPGGITFEFKPNNPNAG